MPLRNRVSLLNEILKTLQILHPSIHQLQLLYFCGGRPVAFVIVSKIHFHLKHPQAYRSPAWIIDYQKIYLQAIFFGKIPENHAFKEGDYQESKSAHDHLVKSFVKYGFYTFKIPKINDRFLVLGIRHQKSRKAAIFTNNSYPANDFWF